MISLFRRNIFINSILLLPYLVLIRIKSLVEPVSATLDDYDGLLVRTIYQAIGDQALSQNIFAILILFLDALLINRLVIKSHIGKENNLVSGMLFVLLVSVLTQNLILSPEMLASPFVILSITGIFNSYNNLKSADDIYLSGFYMSLASLMYAPLLLMLPFTYIGFMIMRSFTGLERTQHLAGWLTPYFLLFVTEYYIGNPISWHFIAFRQGFGLFGVLAKEIGISGLLVLIGLFVVVLWVLANFGNYMGKKVIAAQKRIGILYWFMLFTGLIAVTQQHVDHNLLILLAIPVSIFATFSLLDMKNRIWPELIHLFIILLLVIIHLELIKLAG
ncbi:MAG: DUF6427 family protein [Saprospiraceae bacterium]